MSTFTLPRRPRSSRAGVTGTAKGNLHDIGKNLVAAMFEGGGFEVIDLGVNVTPAKKALAVTP